LINTNNYFAIINQAKANDATRINVNRANELSALGDNLKAEQDTLTLSKSALALMNGQKVEEVAPTYVRPQTATSLSVENKQATKNDGNTDEKHKESGAKFSEIMQAILDQRLGIDREKLEEIDAKIEEVGKDKNLSPEERSKILEQLYEMREQVIEENLETKEVAKQMDDDPIIDDI
jgi:hypothetical protein